MITIECFKGLPIKYESFLIEKYDSFITTCRYVEVYYSTYNINYMLVYENSKLTDLLIFGNKGSTSICFNSLVDIDQNIIIECTQKIFEKYPTVKKVNIVASYKEYSIKKAISCCKSDDYILRLPSTINDYYLELGPKTRKHIKQRQGKLLKDFETVNFITKFGIEIEELIIDKIIQLNCNRMKYKGKNPGIDKNYRNNIYKYSQHYGCVTYLELDGVIVAGCISTILNKKIFLHVIAHDNNFSKYNVGEVCAFHFIQTSIEKGLSTFHFLWGKSELKNRFLAKPHLLFSYLIYRAYSLDYFFNETKAIFSEILICYKNSKISDPIRYMIKHYRRRNLKL